MLETVSKLSVASINLLNSVKEIIEALVEETCLEEEAQVRLIA